DRDQRRPVEETPNTGDRVQGRPVEETPNTGDRDQRRRVEETPNTGDFEEGRPVEETPNTEKEARNLAFTESTFLELRERADQKMPVAPVLLEVSRPQNQQMVHIASVGLKVIEKILENPTDFGFAARDDKTAPHWHNNLRLIKLADHCGAVRAYLAEAPASTSSLEKLISMSLPPTSLEEIQALPDNELSEVSKSVQKIMDQLLDKNRPDLALQLVPAYHLVVLAADPRSRQHILKDQKWDESKPNAWFGLASKFQYHSRGSGSVDWSRLKKFQTISIDFNALMELLNRFGSVDSLLNRFCAGVVKQSNLEAFLKAPNVTLDSKLALCFRVCQEMGSSDDERVLGIVESMCFASLNTYLRCLLKLRYSQSTGVEAGSKDEISKFGDLLNQLIKHEVDTFKQQSSISVEYSHEIISMFLQRFDKFMELLSTAGCPTEELVDLCKQKLKSFIKKLPVDAFGNLLASFLGASSDSSSSHIFSKLSSLIEDTEKGDWNRPWDISLHTAMTLEWPLAQQLLCFLDPKAAEVQLTLNARTALEKCRHDTETLLRDLETEPLSKTVGAIQYLARHKASLKKAANVLRLSSDVDKQIFGAQEWKAAYDNTVKKLKELHALLQKTLCSNIEVAGCKFRSGGEIKLPISKLIPCLLEAIDEWEAKIERLKSEEATWEAAQFLKSLFDREEELVKELSYLATEGDSGDLEQKKIEVLVQVVNDFQEIIYGIEALVSNEERRVTEFLELCRPVMERLQKEPKRIEDLTKTANQLKWIKIIKENQGSVERPTLEKIEEIFKSGSFQIGCLVENTDHFLLTTTKESKADDSPKTQSRAEFTLADVKDLQSKLMLIAGSAYENKLLLDSFVKLTEGILRLVEVYKDFRAHCCLLCEQIDIVVDLGSAKAAKDRSTEAGIEKDQLLATLDLFRSAYDSLPQLEEVLVCSDQTTEEDVSVFMHRSVLDQNSQALYVIMGAEQLSYQNSVFAEDIFSRLLDLVEGRTKAKIFALMADDQQRNFPFCSILASFIQDYPIIPNEKDIRDWTAKFLREQTPEENFRVLNFLPCIQCRSPSEILEAIADGKSDNAWEPLLKDELLTSDSIRKPVKYLLNKKDRRTVQLSAKDVVKLLVENCGIENPSWQELQVFSRFFCRQISDMEKSPYCSEIAGSEIQGFQEFVLKFMLIMSKDFATRSLSISDESGGSQISDGKFTDSPEKEDLQNFQLRRRWEQNSHPYLLFNEDGATFTFVGFTINPAGDLLDQKRAVIQKGIMSQQLYKGLHRQGVHLDEAFDSLPRDEMINKIRMVFGFDNRAASTDPDLSYELTTDNAMKMLAIYMRFRCEIPVVLMGETGCGKTKLVEFLSKLMLPEGHPPLSNIRILKVHGGVSEAEVVSTLREAEKLAAENFSKSKRSPYTIVFFDEVNTTSAVGLIKEVMIDGRAHGKPIDFSKGLRCVAACNPYRKHSEETIKILENSGLGYRVRKEQTSDRFGTVPMRHLVYRVKPLPLSFLQVLWDFGNLTDESERKYIDRIIESRKTAFSEPAASEKELNILKNAIAASQRFMRTSSDEAKFVSLRDVEKAMKMLEWLYRSFKVLLKLLDSQMSEVGILYASSFPKDQEYSKMCTDINKIKVSMERGGTLVLLNIENLYESLYDALNQYYEYCGQDRFVDLGLGTHRLKCKVHKEFRIIVIADQSTVEEKFPIPLINRLEKHKLSTEAILNDEKRYTIRQILEWVEKMKASGEQGLQDIFVGYHSDVVPSLVFELEKVEILERMRRLMEVDPDRLVELFGESDFGEILKKHDFDDALLLKYSQDMLNMLLLETDSESVTQVQLLLKLKSQIKDLTLNIAEVQRLEDLPDVLFTSFYKHFEKNKTHLNSAENRKLWQAWVTDSDAVICRLLLKNGNEEMQLQWDRIQCVFIFLTEVVNAFDSEAHIEESDIKPIQLWNSLQRKLKENFQSLEAIRIIEEFVDKMNTSLTEKILGSKDCSKCKKRSDFKLILPCADRLCAECVADCEVSENHADSRKCPICKQDFDPKAVSGPKQQVLVDFKARCTRFMMQVVSKLCFQAAKPPTEDLCHHLIGFVTRTSKQNAAFGLFGDDRDDSPVFRSFILQRLLKFQPSQVESLLQQHVDAVANFRADARHDLAKIIVNCMEDAQIVRSEAEAMNEEQQLHHAVSLLAESTLPEKLQLLQIPHLQNIASRRVALRVLAFVFSLGNLGEETVNALARALEPHKWSRIYFLRCLSMEVGVSAAIGLIFRNTVVKTTLEAEIGGMDVVPVPDFLLSHSEAYKDSKEYVLSTLYDSKTQKLYNQLAYLTQSPLPDHNAALLCIRLAYVLHANSTNESSAFRKFLKDLKSLADNSYLPAMMHDEIWERLLEMINCPITTKDKEGFLCDENFKMYCCPNGHPYVLGECTQGWVKYKCHECAADIGGQKHKIAANNTEYKCKTKMGFSPPSMKEGQQPLRKLTPASAALIRLLQHLAMLVSPDSRRKLQTPDANCYLRGFVDDLKLFSQVTGRNASSRTFQEAWHDRSDECKLQDVYEFGRIWDELKHRLKLARFEDLPYPVVKGEVSACDLPLAALLPHSSEWGRCIVALVQLLVDAQNAVIDASAIKTEKISLDDIDQAAVIPRDLEAGLLPILLANSSYSLKDAACVEYDFKSLECQLVDFLARGRCRIAPLLSPIVYKDEVHLMQLFKRLERTVPQNSAPSSVH
uniref:RING-type domain-containing protein n=1 Tax=Macrostomum lignano TaxID=282301 RepID=A0A1I8J9G9_9PLAT